MVSFLSLVVFVMLHEARSFQRSINWTGSGTSGSRQEDGGCFFAVCYLSVVSSKSFVFQWGFYLWPPLRNVWSNTDFPCCFVARTLYTPEFKAPWVKLPSRPKFRSELIHWNWIFPVPFVHWDFTSFHLNRKSPLRPDATTSLRGIKRTSRWTFKARSLSSSAISCSKTNVQLGNVQLDIIRSTYAAHQFCVTGDVSKLWAVSWGEWNSWKRLCLSSRSGRNNWSESKHSYEAVTSEGLRLQVPDMRRILKMFFRILQIYNVAQVQRCPDMSKPSTGMISTLCSPTWLYVLDPEKRHHVASVVWQQFVGSHLNSEKQTSGSCWSNMAFVRSDCTTLFDLGYWNLAPFMGIPLDQPV